MVAKPTIYFGDFCYLDEWDYVRPIPLNVGYIAAYLAEHQPDVPIEIFKDARMLIDRAERHPPNILALSYYDWNANLDLAVFRRIKREHPQVIGVVGGPNFEADNPEWIYNFFANRPEIDVFIVGEGEWSFNRLVELLTRYGGRLEDIPHEDRPSSWYSFDKQTRQVIHNPNNPTSRLDLSTVPSPYLTGLMDPFLADPQLTPIFETNRGCPYSCTFCFWGQATRSKVHKFPLETVIEEIRYACERTMNPTGFMYIADANFGIFKRDLEIADAIQECSEIHGRPKRLFIYFAKNTNERIVQIADKLNAVTSMSMSKQTQNADVLDNIKRSNIPVAQYDHLRIECENRGIDSFCELIFGLPGESYNSYVDGVVATLRSGQRVTMYPHVMIPGAESSSREDREKYGIKTAFRVIPTCISTYPELPSLEYEEVVVQTNAMPYADYLRMRLFQFLFFVLSRDMFDEFQRALRYLGLDIATVADLIARDEANWPPLWCQIVQDQRRGVESEFVPDDELKLEFTAKDIKDIAKSDRGLPSLISDSEALQEWRNYLAELIRRQYTDEFATEDIEDLLTALELSFDRILRFDNRLMEKVVSYNVDVEAWLTSNPPKRLREFRCDQQISYQFKADERLLGLVEETEKQLGNLTEALYRVRVSMLFGRSGDRLYTYERTPLIKSDPEIQQLAEMERRRREISDLHSKIATR